MAGDSSTELLFIDTFKHQSAEVICRNISLFCKKRRIHSAYEMLKYLTVLITIVTWQANDVRLATAASFVVYSMCFLLCMLAELSHYSIMSLLCLRLA